MSNFVTTFFRKRDEMNFKIIEFKKIDSTNDYLKNYFSNLDEGTVIVTKYQTKGRGRLTRSWLDSKNNNLTFSILLYPKIANPNLSKLTLMACASVFDVLSKKADNIKIKWPNDILIDNKKICGILTESIFEGNQLKCVIIGIGINVNSKKFPNEIAMRATSLYLATKNHFDLEELLQAILTNFSKHYQMFLEDKHSYIDVCRLNSPYIGTMVKVLINEELKEVKIIDILDNGNLLISDDNQLREIISGEITLI